MLRERDIEYTGLQKQLIIIIGLICDLPLISAVLLD